MKDDLTAPSDAMRVTSDDGTEIAYEKWGEGPPLILVDGAFCQRRFGPTDKLAPELADHFTVYAYDRRGRGESGNGAAYSVDREIEDLAAVVRAAGRPAFVFGMSSGGVLALEAAARGVPMSKLAVYEAPYRVGSRVELPPSDLRRKLQSFLDRGDRGGAVMFYMSHVMNMPWLVAHVILPVTRHWGSLMSTAPTLAMAGGKGGDAMRKASLAIAAGVPTGDSEVLDGQRHDVDPAVLSRALFAYFRKA